MQTSGRDSVKSQLRRLSEVLVLMAIAAATCLLESCGGAGTHAPIASLQAIQISPSTSLILLAGSRQLLATGTYSDGTQQDLTLQVTWKASSTPNTANYVAVNGSGIATGMALGTSVVTASLGSVVGVLQLTVNTNGYSSGTTAILSVPFKTTEVDAAYLPQPQNLIQGAYAVQEVNLDADQFSSVLPVPVALLASVPMPAGFVPNATAASQSSMKVAVISYSSPNVQVIDASNDPTDLTNNTVIATFTAPITKKATFGGITCMICAAVVNPLTDQLVLSTAQGYYTMDLNAGTFAALPLTPTAFPAQNFSINPVAADPYILSPTYGQDPKFPGELQVLNLTTNAVSSNTSLGLLAPNAAALDLFTDYSAVVDASVNDEALVNLADPQHPVSSLVSNVGVCAGQPVRFNMAALGVSVTSGTNAAHTLFSSQTSGNCVGFQVWPTLASQLDASQILYAYGSMPAKPDGNQFVNGNDPNAIATFTSVVDKKNYGMLVDASENWIAKINFATVFSLGNITSGGPSLPAGQHIGPTALNAGIGGDSIVFLPSPSTVVTLSATSINFGNPNVGTPTPPVPVTLANVGANPLVISKIAIQGTNAGDFSETDNCISPLLPQASCAISITFTPAAAGPRSGVLSVSDDGGSSPQTVLLSGTGT